MTHPLRPTPLPRALALLAALPLATLAAPGDAAADAWSGGYIGGHVGQLQDPDDGGDRFLFDTDLDGGFGDVVRTAAGADAFSPGSCDGAARGPTPAAGCRPNTGGADVGLRAGFDWQSGAWVYGVVAEVGTGDVRDGVTSFSTTPAFYTMLRKLDTMAALRARLGYAFGEGGEQLVYATAGVARASIENVHITSNGVNTFTTNGDSSASGEQLGLGYERRFGDWSLGLEYVTTRLDDGDFRVRASGPAPATNPFILVDPAGTDFRRSDEDFDLDSVRLTVAWRF